jgi:hypothetical protein
VISSDDYYEHSDYNKQGQEVDSRTGQKWGPYDYMEFSDDDLSEGINEFAPGAGGGNDDGGEDPYGRPQPRHYNRSVDYFSQFEADHFDREDFDDATGVFKGYWGDDQIAYFKFDNPQRNGSDDPGMGWYYEPQNESVAEGKITLSTDPDWYGATVDNYQASGPVVNIPANQLVGFEPDDKMNQPKSKANVKKIVAGLKQGDKLPPLLVRKYKDGYQVLDGHHRFWAYKLLGVKSIPAQIVPDSDIEEISKQGDLNELSTDKLARYKTAAGADASAADKRGDYERGDKRFSGIVKATKKQFANDLKKHGQQGMAEGSSTASEAVERAILNRIMVSHTNLLMRFGPDKVMQAAEEVAYNVGDVDEIGTSDVSAYVNQVRQILGA